MDWLVLAFISAIFFGLKDVVKKKILQDADVLDMMAGMGAGLLLLMLPFLPFVDFTISSRNLGLIVLVAFLGAAANFLLNIDYKNCEISSIAPLLNLNPLLIILISYILLGEVLNYAQWLGVWLIIAGTYLVTLKNIKSFFDPFSAVPTKYYLIFFGSMVLWSFPSPIKKIILVEVDVYSYLFFFILFDAILRIAVAFLREIGSCSYLSRFWA